MSSSSPVLATPEFTTNACIQLMAIWVIEFASDALVSTTCEENEGFHRATHNVVVVDEAHNCNTTAKTPVAIMDCVSRNHTSISSSNRRPAPFFSKNFIKASKEALQYRDMHLTHIKTYTNELLLEAELHQNRTTERDNYLTRFADVFDNATNALSRYRNERVLAHYEQDSGVAADQKDYIQCRDLVRTLMRPLKILQTGLLAADVLPVSKALATTILDSCLLSDIEAKKYMDTHPSKEAKKPYSGRLFDDIPLKKRSTTESSDRGHEDFLHHWTDPAPLNMLVMSATTLVTASSSATTPTSTSALSLSTTTTSSTVLDLPKPPSNGFSSLISWQSLLCFLGVLLIFPMIALCARPRRRFRISNRHRSESHGHEQSHQTWYNGGSHYHNHNHSSSSSRPPPGSWERDSLLYTFRFPEVELQRRAKEERQKARQAAAAAAAAVGTTTTTSNNNNNNNNAPPPAKARTKTTSNSNSNSDDDHSIGGETLCWPSEPAVLYTQRGID